MTPVNPSVASSTDDECPGYGNTTGVQPPKVQVRTCAARGMQSAITVVNPALAIMGVLLTPELRIAAFLATLRTEVARRSGKEHTR